jgi:L-threonylcarbamoyladenylate synthase
MQPVIQPAAVADAVRVLAAHALVVFPTESVYGIGADAHSPDAVERLVALRGREPGKPILVLVRDLAMAARLAVEVPPVARRLAARFWPGPLTLVLPAREGLPAPLAAGTGTIGVRQPGHPLAAALVDGLDGPVTAPSANPPGAAPAHSIAEARAYFGGAVTCYLDGGRCAGAPSTVAAVESGRVRVLRAGPVSEAALRAAMEGDE